MRAAALILAHRHPALLARLIGSLQHRDIDVFVHIDARADARPFIAAAAGAGRALFLDRRVRVHWGGHSVVQATLALLDDAAVTATATGRAYDRFLLLSGADTLVRPVADLRRALSTDTEYLRVDRPVVPGPRWRQVSRRHFPDLPVPGLRRVSGRIPRTVPTTVPLYQGSMWWALTADAVEHIHRFRRAHPDWLRFFRYSHCSDEIVFASILKASPRAHQIAHDIDRIDPGPRARAAFHTHPVHGLHYIDWSDVEACSPRTLTLEDLPAVRSSGAMFARKVAPESAALLDAIPIPPVPR